MKFIFSEDYNIYPIGFPMSLTGYTWLGKVGIGMEGNSIDIVEESVDNKAVSLKAINDSCGLSVWFPKEADEYIFETDIKLQSDDACFCIYADDKDDYLKESIFRITKKASKKDNWLRVGLKLDFKKNLAKAYVDGNFYGDMPLGIKEKPAHDNTNMIYIKAVSEGADLKESVVLVDNTAVYEGNCFVDQAEWKNAVNDRFSPVADFGEKTRRMRNMLLLCMGTRAVKRFGKNARLPENSAPYYKDGRVMLPVDYIKECFMASEVNSFDKEFVSAEDAARIVGCDLKIYKSGIIALGDKDTFFDEDADSDTVELLTKLLKTTDNELPLFTEEADFHDIIKRIELNKYPTSRAWEETKKSADKALTTHYPMILQGYVEHYMHTATKAAGAVRDLAFAFRVTGDEKYLNRAVEILKEWSAPENPLPISRGLNRDVNGLITSRSMVPFAYGYSILYNYIEDTLKEKIEEWFVKMGQGFIYANDDWIDNDYFEKQYYQNHIVVHMMGIVTLGLASRNIDLLSYALYPEGKSFSYEKLLQGAIIGYDDKEIYEKDPCFTHNYPFFK